MLLASNHMFPTGSIEVVFERLAKAGAGGLDIFLPHIQFVNTPHFGPENLKRCREAAEAVGLPIVSMIGCAAPPNLGFGNYLGPDPDKGRAEAIAFIKHNVQLCKAMGATHFNSAEGRLPDGADEKAIWARLVRTLKEAAPILEAGGVTFDIELHPGLIASTPEKALPLIRRSVWVPSVPWAWVSRPGSMSRRVRGRVTGSAKTGSETSSGGRLK